MVKHMLKSVLREHGYAEETKYPKEHRIAWIWVLSTILIVTGIYTSILLIKNTYRHTILGFFNEINHAMNFDSSASVIYAGVWIFIFVVLAFIIRNKSNGKMKKVILRTTLIILIVLMIFFFMISVAVGVIFDINSRIVPFYGFFDEILGYIYNIPFVGRIFIIFGLFGLDVKAIGAVVLLIIFELIYCAVKLCISMIYTRNKESIVKLKILKGKGIPVCYNSEAFKVSQIAAMYITPIIFIYSILYILMTTPDSELLPFYMVICLFMTIFITFDTTAVIYALFCKAKYKIDYIAFDHHLYESNIFKKKS